MPRSDKPRSRGRRYRVGPTTAQRQEALSAITLTDAHQRRQDSLAGVAARTRQTYATGVARLFDFLSERGISAWSLTNSLPHDLMEGFY